MNFNFSLDSINNYNELPEVTIDNITTNNNNNNNIKMFEFNKNIKIYLVIHIYILKHFQKIYLFDSFTLNI